MYVKLRNDAPGLVKTIKDELVTPASQPSINPIALFPKQLTLFASNLYPEWMLPEIFAFVQRHKIPLSSIITHQARLSDAPEMFRLADSATAGKIMFRF